MDFATVASLAVLAVEGNRAEFIARIQDYMAKALHEAKVNSSWLEPNVAWDAAVRDFVAAILAPGPRNRFPHSLSPLAERIAQLGAVNSLAQTVLKLTCPGVPDFYQGTELWDFSLVDPDNRRPVDYPLRCRHLDSLGGASPQELLENWRDGRLKMLVIHRLLRLRHERPELFARGAYMGVSAHGAFADKVIALERREADAAVMVIVPRHTEPLGFPPIGARWQDTHISPSDAAARWRDVFTGRGHAGDTLSMTEAFAVLPFAVLVEVPN